MQDFTFRSALHPPFVRMFGHRKRGNSPASAGSDILIQRSAIEWLLNRNFKFTSTHESGHVTYHYKNL